MEMIRNHDQELIRYGLDIFDKELPQIRIIGPHSPQQRCGLMAFSHPQIHPHDLAQFLDSKHICVRSGLHCAEPIHRFLELNNGSVRASFWVYNEKEDIEKLVLGIQEAETVFL
jgi:cysteine desulfurase/selenocysteine lyase